MSDLHEIVTQNDSDRLEEILQGGKVDVNCRDEEWGYRSSVHWAAIKGFGECLRMLIENGASTSAKDYCGRTPAHFAAESGRIHILRIIFQSSGPIHQEDKWGKTPKDYARIHNYHDCAEYLLQCETEYAVKRNAFFEDPDNASLTPLFDVEDNTWSKFEVAEWGNEDLPIGPNGRRIYVAHLMTLST